MLMQLFLQGLRADIIVICLLLVVLVLLIPLASVRGFGKFWFQFNYLWCLSALVLLVFMELASPAFILQCDVRPNLLFVEYLKYPKEVLSTLWFGFRLPLPLPLPLLLGVIATVALT